MADQVQEVKRKADIVAIISEKVKLQKAGRNWRGLCPFHSEKTPSFNVSPELQIYKCFGCFPAGQFVKTPFGYHKIEDVVDEEYVVSGKGSIQRVLTTHQRRYQGNLVSLRLSQLSEWVSLTEDHAVYVIGGAPLYSHQYKYLSKRLNAYRKYEKPKKLAKTWKYFPIVKVKAGELTPGMSLLYPVDTATADVDSLDLSDYITKQWPAHGTRPLVPPLQIAVNRGFLKLLGYYIAEGSNHRAYIRFSLGNHEEEFAQEIVELIDKIFGLEAKIYYRPVNTGKTGLEVTVCSSILANVFENLCGKGAANKHVPFVLQQLPSYKQQILLEAIFRGDGYEGVGMKGKTLRRAITTVSRTLSEQLTDMLLRAGFFPSRSIQNKKIDSLGVSHRVAHTVSWSADSRVSKFHHLYETIDGSVYWILPIVDVYAKPFRGRVYNLTVDTDHSYVANTFAVSNCGEAGDVFTFLEKYEGMEFGEALRYVADRVGVRLAEYRPTHESQKRERYLEILNLAAEFYHYLLIEHRLGEDARQYLKKRGVWKQTQDTWRLGYAPEGWDNLYKYLVGKKGYEAREVEGVGLIVKSNKQQVTSNKNYYDRFRGRVMFPLTNQRGQVLGMAGRLLDPEAKESKYVNTPETELYHKSELLFGLSITREEIKKADRVVVVEGEFDAMSSWQQGVKNVVAIKGSAFTQEQIQLLARYTHNIALALDADMAGDEATKRSITLADSLGMNVRVVELAGGKDPDEIAQQDKEQWKKMVAKAVNVYDFYLDSALRRWDGGSGEGKREISRRLLPILALIPNTVEQAHYVQKVAKALKVSEEVIYQEMQRVVPGVGRPDIKLSSYQVTEELGDDATAMEEYVVGLLLRSDEQFLVHLARVQLAWIESAGVRRLVKVLGEEGERFLREGNLKVGELVEALPEELKSLAQKIWLKSSTEELVDIEKELTKSLRLLERQYVQGRLGYLTGQMRVLEHKKGKTLEERQALRQLREEFVKVSGELGN